MKAASGTSLTKRDIFGLVQEDLEEVEKNLKRLTTGTIPLIDNINQYLHASGGKRLRPAVLLLCSRLCGQRPEGAIRLAAVVELIHVATLVHDDIIDNSNIRRGQPSVNAQWGNQITVLAGDWMYMTAFYIALELQNFRILNILIDITRKMVEGELRQLELDGRIDISVADQMEILQRKTADLFSGCGRLAGIISGLDEAAEERLASYGRCLGIVFQLTDDLLDYTSNEAVLGKPVLKDLEEGKITLPIIYLLQRAQAEEISFLSEVIQKRDFSRENKGEIISLLGRYGALQELEDLARRHAQEARECLLGFPDSIYREALLNIPEMILNRRK